MFAYTMVQLAKLRTVKDTFIYSAMAGERRDMHGLPSDQMRFSLGKTDPDWFANGCVSCNLKLVVI